MEGGRQSEVDGATSSLSLFLRDLRWSLWSWSTGPWFVLLVAAVWAASVAVDLKLPILSIPFALFLAGFYGTQWVFYFRRLTDRELQPHEVPKQVWGYMGRFVRLGLIVTAPLLVIIIVTVATRPHTSTGGGLLPPPGGAASRPASTSLSASWRIIIILYEFVVDIGLTFVAPALVYSTTSAVEALRTGLKRLRGTLPSSAWYALTPGLTLGLVALVIPRSVLGVGATLGLAIAGGLLGFAFKGAIAPYYLRDLSDFDRKVGLADP